MSARTYLKLYLLIVPIFLAIDLLWLGVIAAGFYRDHLGPLLAPAVNWPAALVFYPTYCAGILMFAVGPGVRAASLLRTLVAAAGFGFFTYFTYHLTNLATLPDWPLVVVLVDTAWGVALCSMVAACVFLLASRLPGVSR